VRHSSTLDEGITPNTIRSNEKENKKKKKKKPTPLF
jgi:hypothetical protein